MGTQQFSLRWNNYLRHITGAFDSLRTDSDLVDVTLSCEGKKIKAHKMLLSACSSYFKDLFKDNPCQHPVIIFRNVKFDDLDALVNFMYQGEVNVLQDQLASFLTTAELLEVQGLTDGGNNPEDEEEAETEQAPPPPVPQFRPEKRRSQPQSNNQAMSPVSFIPINKRPESPPQKRRKFVSSTSNVQSGDKELESRRPSQQQHPSPDPVEVIPVVPNVKVEKPDYYDGDQGGGEYSDNLHTSNSNQDLPEMLEHGQLESKQEVDIYDDSGDSSHVEGLSDLNQILSKPGTSVESVSQESLHDEKPPEDSENQDGNKEIASEEPRSEEINAIHSEFLKLCDSVDPSKRAHFLSNFYRHFKSEGVSSATIGGLSISVATVDPEKSDRKVAKPATAKARNSSKDVSASKKSGERRANEKETETGGSGRHRFSGRVHSRRSAERTTGGRRPRSASDHSRSKKFGGKVIGRVSAGRHEPPSDHSRSRKSDKRTSESATAKRHKASKSRRQSEEKETLEPEFWEVVDSA